MQKYQKVRPYLRKPKDPTLVGPAPLLSLSYISTLSKALAFLCLSIVPLRKKLGIICLQQSKHKLSPLLAKKWSTTAKILGKVPIARIPVDIKNCAIHVDEIFQYHINPLLRKKFKSSPSGKKMS